MHAEGLLYHAQVHLEIVVVSFSTTLNRQKWRSDFPRHPSLSCRESELIRRSQQG